MDKRKIIKLSVIGIIFLVSIYIVFGYVGGGILQEKEYKELSQEVTTLNKLHNKYPDVIGWIRINGTSIDYPVMNGREYLYKDKDGKGSEFGTPFVESDWTDKTTNSMIFGHNIWIQKTMFNPLHKYESKHYWGKHKEGVFYALREDGQVEKRHFTIRNVVLTSTKDKKFLWYEHRKNKTYAAAFQYEAECDDRDLYDTGVPKESSTVTLCTCSYHIDGDRHAGRLLVVGAIDNVTIDNVIISR